MWRKTKIILSEIYTQFTVTSGEPFELCSLTATFYVHFLSFQTFKQNVNLLMFFLLIYLFILNTKRLYGQSKMFYINRHSLKILKNYSTKDKM